VTCPKLLQKASSPVAEAGYCLNATVNTQIRSFFYGLKHKGFSLIELMIALAIGSLIALAISTLFFQLFSGYRATSDTARTTEGGNFGLRILGEDIRMAGFVGLFNDPARVELARTDMIGATATDNCGSTQWPFQLYDPTSGSVSFIQHFANPGSLACVPAGGFVANNPAVVIRRASGVQASAADLTTNSMFIQSSPTGAIIFMGKDYATKVNAVGRGLSVRSYSEVSACPGPSTPPAPLSADCALDNAASACITTNGKNYASYLCPGPIFQYLANIYYIRPCSRPAGAVCAATDDGGQPIPTLVRRQLSNTDPAVFVETPIAEGVEMMNLYYGLDTNNDGVPDTYTYAPTDLSNAVTVRLSLLMRTPKPDNNYTDTATYTLVDPAPPALPVTFNCTTAGASCKHRRYVLTDTIQLKNYVVRR
jgi:type IV pilus assembly protein PilW